MAPATADAVITCIQSALDDAPARVLRFKLRKFKTFVLCSRKLGYIQSLTSLLLWIEDVVGRKPLDPFEIESLEKEINDWYITMFDYARARLSTSLLIREASELISSVLETLADFFDSRCPNVDSKNLGEAAEALREQVTFLKCLVEFATLIGPESTIQGLMVHVEAVALDAAYLLFTCEVDEFDEAKLREMEFKISSMLLQVKPFDLQTYEIYSEVLSGSKVLIQSLDRDVDVISAGRLLLASLLSNLWRMLKRNDCYVVPLMYQLQELYGGLESLRSVLDQQLSFDVKMKDDIVAVVCDAGVLICSLYYHQTQQVDLGIQHLLETVALILATFGKENPRVPIFNFKRANELGLIDILSKQLTELICCGAKPAAASCLRTIQEELVFLKFFFMENVELCNEQEELRARRDHVLEMAFKLKNLIDHLEVGDLPYSFLQLLDSIMKDIGSIKGDVLKVCTDKRPKVKAHEVTLNLSQMPLPTTSMRANEILGRREDELLLLDRLTRGSKGLQIITIVGKPGVGKTTLATSLYNSLIAAHHFHIRARCHISQVVDRKKVLLELLNQIAPRLGERLEESEEDLVERVWRSLKGRRYLIFLDDLLDIETLDALRYGFPDDTVGSRIIVTSHNCGVAPGEKPHMLRFLSMEESLELLQMKLFSGSAATPTVLRDLAVKIVDICGGLPLAIIWTAGLLATMEPKPDVWEKVWYGLRSRSIGSSSEVYVNILDLSYEYLPDHLKPCFLYLAAFSKDQNVSVWRLLRLWIAEGFVQRDVTGSLEAVAENYLRDLIGRELIMVAKRKSDGGIKACCAHDLVHKFCLQKAREENIFYFLKGGDEVPAYYIQSDLWRLIIDYEPEQLKESKLFCPRVRSVLLKSSQQTRRDEQERGSLLDTSFLLCTFKLVHVLNLEQIDVGCVFPSELEVLVQLAFLAIRGEMRQIPSSIVNLSKLETLIVDAGPGVLSLPSNLGNLSDLQFLYIRSWRSSGGGSLPETVLDNSSVLHGLETFSSAVVPSWGIMERLMLKFPNIRKLKCRRAMDQDDTANVEKSVVLNFMSQLQSLHLSSYNACQFQFYLPESLKKLTLSGFHFLPEKISTLSHMPNLQVLKLLNVSFAGNVWKMKEEEFPNLRALKLHSPGLFEWSFVDEDGLYSLEKLVLDGCQQLEEVPLFLGESPMLQVIEVNNCSRSVVDSAMRILEEQRELGNDYLKVLVDKREL